MDDLMLNFIGILVGYWAAVGIKRSAVKGAEKETATAGKDIWCYAQAASAQQGQQFSIMKIAALFLCPLSGGHLDSFLPDF